MLDPILNRKIRFLDQTSTFGETILGHYIRGHAFVRVSKIQRFARFDVFGDLVAESVDGGLDYGFQSVDFLL